MKQAGRCAVNYLQVSHASAANRVIVDYEQIDVRERAWHLIRTYQLNPSISGSGNNFAVDLNRFVQGKSNSLQLGVNGNVVLFPEASIKDDLDSQDRSAQLSAIQTLAACDDLYGFTPKITAIDLTSDFDCAVSYWLLGAFNPAQRAMASERTRFAMRRHIQVNPDTNAAQLEQQVLAEGQSRGRRIQQGLDSANVIQETLGRCESQYGLGQ
ncbi:hypothetical protein [Aliidiomarina iranensis]|nr:hypothetical protein [Aliidiomarina iranensis]